MTLRSPDEDAEVNLSETCAEKPFLDPQTRRTVHGLTLKIPNPFSLLYATGLYSNTQEMDVGSSEKEHHESEGRWLKSNPSQVVQIDCIQSDGAYLLRLQLFCFFLFQIFKIHPIFS